MALRECFNSSRITFEDDLTNQIPFCISVVVNSSFKSALSRLSCLLQIFHLDPLTPSHFHFRRCNNNRIILDDKAPLFPVKLACSPPTLISSMQCFNMAQNTHQHGLKTPQTSPKCINSTWKQKQKTTPTKTPSTCTPTKTQDINRTIFLPQLVFFFFFFVLASSPLHYWWRRMHLRMLGSKQATLEMNGSIVGNASDFMNYATTFISACFSQHLSKELVIHGDSWNIHAAP